MDLQKMGDLFIVRGGGAALGFVSSDALMNFARNALQLPPTGMPGLAVEGLGKGVFAVLAAAGADKVRGEHAFIAEGLDYAAAGAVASFLIDVLRVLGVSPLGAMGHMQPPRVLPAQYYAPAQVGGPVLFRPQGGQGGFRPMAVPVPAAYAAAGTVPVGYAGQVNSPPTVVRLKGPNQPVQSVAPRVMVS